jgi:hypothetical protein
MASRVCGLAAARLKMLPIGNIFAGDGTATAKNGTDENQTRVSIMKQEQTLG